MFILEKPYISELLLSTLEQNKFVVLGNDYIKLFQDKYNLNILGENQAKWSNDKIYTNSEGSLEWILNNCKNENLINNIQYCKNKYIFRKKLQKLYPNFYYKEFSFNELEKIKESNISTPAIIKPSVGFLSAGVHKINKPDDIPAVIDELKSEVQDFEKFFSKSVLNSSSFIIEELLQGTEYAIDAYYTEQGKPVILNIFKHPFADENDVSDRAYITSKKIISEKLIAFTKMLEKIGNIFEFKNFPMHIEVIEDKTGQIIPVEINPQRFAGWCTTDLAYFAYGINIYEYYTNQIEPDWNKIFSNIGDEIYYFAMADVPAEIANGDISSFNYDLLKQNFSNILDFRKIDFSNNPLFAIIFGKTTDYNEITRILKLDMKSFISF